MKKWILGLSLMSVLPAFAQTSFSIVNQNEPNRRIIFECLDTNCDTVGAEYYTNYKEGWSIRSTVLNQDKLKEISKSSVNKKVFDCSRSWRFPDNDHPGVVQFGLSRSNISQAKKDMAKGYEAEAILRYFAIPIMFVGDLAFGALLPMTVQHLTSCIVENENPQHVSREEKKLAKSRLRAMEDEIRDASEVGQLELKERYFKKLVKQLFGLKTRR